MVLHSLYLLASLLVLTSGGYSDDSDLERVYEIIINKNITGLKHFKSSWLRTCEEKCTDDDNCHCFYYQQSNSSCSVMHLNACNNILGSTLPETNGTSTVLMVVQDKNGKRKKSSDYQTISGSVKFPNITIKTWRYCEYFCSFSPNCCGYSHKYTWCRLLIMNDYCNNTKVLLSDGNFTDLTKPIKWSFNDRDFTPPTDGGTPNITYDDVTPDDDLIITSETSTKPQISDTTETTTTPKCSCVCEDVTRQPPTEEELEILKDNLKKELAVDKKKLSKTIRAKTSAPDERQSAQGIGFIGVILLSALPIFIFIIDLPQLYADMKTFYRNVSSLCSNRTPR